MPLARRRRFCSPDQAAQARRISGTSSTTTGRSIASNSTARRWRWIIAVTIAGQIALAPAASAVLPGPNGKIVFTSGRDDGAATFDSNHAQLWVAAKAGATPVRVTVNAAIQHRHASWSPDRTKLVYSAGDAATGDYDIYILDLTQPSSGTNPRNVTQSPGIAEDRPSWSPDGTRIAYQSKVLPTGTTQIVVHSANGPGATTLSQPAGTGDAGKPVWSPDSQTLFYSLVVNPGPPLDEDIYKQAADGTGTATSVITGPNDDYQPALSPDGSSLCFTRGAFGSPNATVQKADSLGLVTEIANSGLGDYNCAWSPDGTKIAYVQGIFTAGDLKMKNSDGTGPATDLVPNVPGRFDGNPDWTRNPSPSCQDQSLTIPAGTTVTVPLSCTDPAPENDPVTRSILTPPTHGTLGSVGQNTVTYTPPGAFAGTDQFTFRGNDGTSDSNVATIRLTVGLSLSSLTVLPGRWRLGSGLPRVSRKAPVGTTISFSLSSAAAATLSFARSAAGRTVNHRCVAPGPANRRRPRCVRFLNAGRLPVAGHAGVNRMAFFGRLSRTNALTVGSYRVTVNATGPTGIRATPRSATFAIVSR